MSVPAWMTRTFKEVWEGEDCACTMAARAKIRQAARVKRERSIRCVQRPLAVRANANDSRDPSGSRSGRPGLGLDPECQLGGVGEAELRAQKHDVVKTGSIQTIASGTVEGYFDRDLSAGRKFSLPFTADPRGRMRQGSPCIVQDAEESRPVGNRQRGGHQDGLPGEVLDGDEDLDLLTEVVGIP